MVSPSYCSREDVKAALDAAETARNNDQVDRAVQAATNKIHSLTHRIFYPLHATYTFRNATSSSRLWLTFPEIWDLESLSVNGVDIDPDDVTLEPFDGPPYNSIQLASGASGAFPLRSRSGTGIVASGLWGFLDEEPVGRLAGGLADNSDASASVIFTTHRIGVGEILRVNDERMIVKAKTMADSGQTIGSNLTANMNDVIFGVQDGAAFSPGLFLLVDAERMLVVDVAGDNLIVKRAFDGSVLAAHTTGASVYTNSGVQLQRAELGTEIAAHEVNDEIYKHNPPPLIRDLAVAEAINQILQEGAGYARTSGSGENQRETRAAGLKQLREDVYAAFGRKVRTVAV